jgi:hypothetical protein
VEVAFGVCGDWGGRLSVPAQKMERGGRAGEVTPASVPAAVPVLASDPSPWPVGAEEEGAYLSVGRQVSQAGRRWFDVAVGGRTSLTGGIDSHFTRPWDMGDREGLGSGATSDGQHLAKLRVGLIWLNFSQFLIGTF